MPTIRHLYVSPGHNFRGRQGEEPGPHPVVELDNVQCVAGQGLVGDRYFGHQEDFKGQITFFALEVHRQLCARFGQPDLPPSAYRRNVITEGLDLLALIGKEFELQGIRFLGTEECRPCRWMNRVVAPGAEDALQGHGGLRAKVLTDGILRRDG